MVHTRYEEAKHTTINENMYRTRAQLLDFYKSEAMVDAIIAEKVSRGGHWSKPHPECPHLPDATLYLCWSLESTADETVKGNRQDMQREKDYDLDDNQTAETVRLLMDAPFTHGGSTSSDNQADVMARAESVVQKKMQHEKEEAAAAAEENKAKRRAQLLASKSPQDVALAALQKLANQASSRSRAAALAAHEIKAITVSDDERALLSARQIFLVKEYDKLSNDLAAQTVNKAASAEELNVVMSGATAKCEELNGLWHILNKMVSPSAKSKGKAKAQKNV
jgi:hypothetical protein